MIGKLKPESPTNLMVKTHGFPVKIFPFFTNPMNGAIRAIAHIRQAAPSAVPMRSTNANSGLDELDETPLGLNKNGLGDEWKWPGNLQDGAPQ